MQYHDIERYELLRAVYLMDSRQPPVVVALNIVEGWNIILGFLLQYKYFTANVNCMVSYGFRITG